MAKHLRVHASLLSHVFRGPKNITPEQACSLAEFLALGELETDYLVALVERARAGSVSLERTLGRRLKMLRERHLQIEHRIRQTDFVFTAAVALSREDAAKVRELLSACVSRIADVVEPSKSETLVVFNVDFLEL